MRRDLLRHWSCGAFLMAALSADTAGAACTQSSEAGTVKKSVRQAMKCDDKLLRSGNASCTVTPPPACAGTLVTDANNLAYGLATLAEVDKRALRDQLKCQKRIGKALSYYVGTKLVSLIRGKAAAEAEAKAIKHLDRLADYCNVPVAQDMGTGLVLPAVGPQCAAAIGVPAGTVNTTALRNCLRQLSEVWVDRWGPNPQPLRPNIIFILSDDQRWDTTDDTHSLVPGQNVMPGLRSELGGAGAEFINAFMTTPLCCPSRSSILSGQYSHTTGVYTNAGDNGGADDFDDSVSIGTILQSAGYRTGFHGKYMNGYQQLWTDPAPPYVPPGWNDWQVFKQVRYFDYTMIENGAEVYYGFAEDDYSTDVLRKKAIQFIDDSVDHHPGQPFFLHLSFKAPHGPFNPPDAGPAPRHDGMFAGLAPWRPASHNEPDVSDKPTWVKNTPPLTAMEIANLDNVRIRQLEMLQAVDEAIGGSTTYGITGIMQHLRNRGIADNTIVIYFSDNGWHWGEHRYRAKNKPYEESIRAPMFVYYPKLVPLPRVESKFALNIDFCPTFAELALRPTDPVPPITFEGVSLLHLIDGTAPTWRTDFLTEGWPASHVWASVREANWKYTELPLMPGNPLSDFEYELYDLQNDPLELTSLHNEPSLAMRMANMYARLRQLRPLWPDDSDAAAEEPDDDE
jgi:N-acetylglucosamine-6-sulfatase